MKIGRPIIVLASLLILGASSRARAEPFSNDSVIALSRANAGDATIIAKIVAMPCAYDLSVPHLARLKRARVSNAVITALLQHCGADRSRSVSTANSLDGTPALSPGFYVLQDGEGARRLLQIVPAIVAPGHAGGNGSFLFPSKSRLSLPGEMASTVAPPRRPTFWIVTEEGRSRVVEFGENPVGLPPPFANLRLARLDTKDGQRVIAVDSKTPSSAYSGVDPHHVQAITVTRRSASVHVVEITHDLAPGEYALIAGDTRTAYWVYDFSVK